MEKDFIGHYKMFIFSGGLMNTKFESLDLSIQFFSYKNYSMDTFSPFPSSKRASILKASVQITFGDFYSIHSKMGGRK